VENWTQAVIVLFLMIWTALRIVVCYPFIVAWNVLKGLWDAICGEVGW
jgi:hypothetical protein